MGEAGSQDGEFLLIATVATQGPHAFVCRCSRKCTRLEAVLQAIGFMVEGLVMLFLNARLLRATSSVAAAAAAGGSRASRGYAVGVIRGWISMARGSPNSSIIPALPGAACDCNRS